MRSSTLPASPRSAPCCRHLHVRPSGLKSSPTRLGIPPARSTEARAMSDVVSAHRTAPESQTAREDHVEMLLGLALEATFPASDALALPLGADGDRTRPAE